MSKVTETILYISNGKETNIELGVDDETGWWDSHNGGVA